MMNNLITAYYPEIKFPQLQSWLTVKHAWTLKSRLSIVPTCHEPQHSTCYFFHIAPVSYFHPIGQYHLLLLSVIYLIKGMAARQAAFAFASLPAKWVFKAQTPQHVSSHVPPHLPSCLSYCCNSLPHRVPVRSLIASCRLSNMTCALHQLPRPSV